MNSKVKLLGLLCAVGLLVGAGQSASAAEVLYDSTGFLKGQQSFTQSFDINAPGTLTVTLTNITWPEKLASLNMLVSTASGLLSPQMGEGTSSIQVEAGNICAQWFGTAQGALNLGVYAMKIEFQPSASVVPLPTSVALLLSGLALLGWQRRQRGEFAPGAYAT